MFADLWNYQFAGALVGGFYYPLLLTGLVGVVIARPRRQQWYAAVLAAGLGCWSGCQSNHDSIPITPRYIYWVYPALYLAAAEGAWFLGRQVDAALAQWRSWNAFGVPVAGSMPTWIARGVLAALVIFQLAVSLADVFGQYHFVVLLTRCTSGLQW